jgi:hypothetical protein
MFENKETITISGVIKYGVGIGMEEIMWWPCVEARGRIVVGVTMLQAGR